ncbi:Uu.00g036470.m01.CDS01 [Anthostomella pinea]|uniref:Uu.00g036470.m01.CDS01 n=1 Tax=Anthostomella pinea TaxID=933095 RepID=A0AAI8V9F9_9PEZI|nr:Uu.00g036470.m01.CDS01 [Anthostomella pinea]
MNSYIKTKDHSTILPPISDVDTILRADWVRHYLEKHTDETKTICAICGDRLQKRSLRKHVAGHTGSSHVLNIGKTTWSKSELRKHAPSKLDDNGFDFKFDIGRAKELAVSYPATIRHSGGRVKEGPLVGQVVQGYPQVFYKDGRIKRNYEWLKAGTAQTRRYALNAPNASDAHRARPQQCSTQTKTMQCTLVSASRQSSVDSLVRYRQVHTNPDQSVDSPTIAGSIQCLQTHRKSPSVWTSSL